MNDKAIKKQRGDIKRMPPLFKLPCAARVLYGSRGLLLHEGLVAFRDIDAASGSSDALALNVVLGHG